MMLRLGPRIEDEAERVGRESARGRRGEGRAFAVGRDAALPHATSGRMRYSVQCLPEIIDYESISYARRKAKDDVCDIVITVPRRRPPPLRSTMAVVRSPAAPSRAIAATTARHRASPRRALLASRPRRALSSRATAPSGDPPPMDPTEDLSWRTQQEAPRPPLREHGPREERGRGHRGPDRGVRALARGGEPDARPRDRARSERQVVARLHGPSAVSTRFAPSSRAPSARPSRR